MKKSILLPAAMAVFMAISFVSCSNGSDDSTNDTKGGNSSDGSGSSGTSLTITYTSVKPDDANTGVGGWVDLQKEYYTLDGSEYYPKDVPSKKTVTATSEAEGYSKSYKLTAEDLPELSHKYLTFAGWYDESNTKKEVGDSIFADTSLNARWEDGKTTGSIVYKRTDEVNTSANNILGSAYTYSGNYNKSFGTPVGILVQSKYYLADTVSYFIMNLNESSEKLSWAAENSTAATIMYNNLMCNGVSSDSYGRDAYSTLTGTYNLSADTIPAIKYCHDLTDNGLTWFLPSLSEINGLTDDCFELINNSLKTLNSNGITATELTTDSTEAEDNNDGVYWTSSISGTDGKVSQAWNLFKSGSAMKWSDYKTTAHRVRAFADVDENFAKSTL